MIRITSEGGISSITSEKGEPILGVRAATIRLAANEVPQATLELSPSMSVEVKAPVILLDPELAKCPIYVGTYFDPEAGQARLATLLFADGAGKDDLEAAILAALEKLPPEPTKHELTAAAAAITRLLLAGPLLP